jgi:diacylglycerol kinase (ATP)
MRSRSLLWSFNYAIEGIVYALRTQRNMRLHALATLVVLVAAMWFRISGLELIALLFAICLVLVAELANTALEATVDIAVDGHDPLAKTAKDVAAGAVLVASVNAVAVGYVVFFGRVTPLAQQLMQQSGRSAVTLTLVALGITALAVLVLKAMNREKGSTLLSGGWPSGHTALAFGIATAIGYQSRSAAVFVLALFGAALVAQSRIESEAHTIPQTILGGLLGFLIMTAVFQVFFR